MKKALKISAGVLVVCGVMAGGVYMMRNTLIEKAVEKFVPDMTGTPVSIAAVDFRPFSGHLSVNGLTIGNPRGFSDNPVLSLGTVSVNMMPSTLLKNKIIIKDVLIDTVSARYEWANGTSNIAEIQANMNKQTDKPATTKTSKKESAAKQVVIKHFALKNAEVSADLAGIPVKLPLPDITLKDLGEDKPSTLKEIAVKIMNVFSAETFNSIKNATGEAVKSTTKSIKGLIKKLF